MTASCFIHSVLFLFPLRIMGCGKEETKPTRASLSWTPALSAWPRLAQTHKHAINADIYDTLTSSGGQNKWEQSFQRTGGTGAPVKMSGTVKGAQRPLRWPLEDPDSTELSLDHILYWKYLLSRSMSVNVQINCEVKSVPEQGWQSCFFFFFLIPTCFNFIEFSAAHLTSVGKNLQWEWNFQVTGKHYWVFSRSSSRACSLCVRLCPQLALKEGYHVLCGLPRMASHSEIT